MISIQVIASGSKANCYRISDGETVLMIECGVRFSEVQKAFNFELSDVAGCLISHSHKDHCKAAKDLARAGMDLWMSEQTRKEIGIEGHRIHTFKSKAVFSVGTFRVMPFFLKHDVENHGFLLRDKDGEKLVYITDTAFVDFVFSDVNYYMVECNHYAPQMERLVKAETISQYLHDRIKRSHLELSKVRQLFRDHDLTKCQGIHLIHISETNGDAKFFQTEIQKLTGKPVYIGE